MGRFAANLFGLHDMAGNVWEWCSDWCQSEHYADSPTSDPLGPATGVARVLRGGSWGSFAENIRVSIGNYYEPDSFDRYLGFRCVRSQQPPDAAQDSLQHKESGQ